MFVPKLTLAFVCIASLASVAAAQDPNAQAMQMQVQKIAQERPREAEAAARAFMMLIAPERAEGPRSLDSLKARSLDQYWMEVAQLTVQFDMVQNLVRRDSVRAQLVAKMFGLESSARELQRAYRGAGETQRTALRAQLETLIGGHFDIENQLRVLEMKDIERRLADVRAETQRRLDKRGEFVKWAVDDIIRDATRPQ
jgi:hypothetical protein